MSEAARWALERGATVGLLEQLISSRTVGSTLLTLIHFRLFSVISFSLVITWAMSPLGTQALLRMKSTRLEPRFRDTSVTYFDNSADSKLLEHTYWGGPALRKDASYFRALAAMYTTLISTPDAIKTDTMDLWGNVKIPFLNHTKSEWQDVQQDAPDFPYMYSSLAGIPLNNINDGNTSFTVESSHVRLRCENVTFVGDGPGSPPRNGSMVEVNATALSDAGSIVRQGPFNLTNGTWHGYPIRQLTDDDNLATTWSLAIDRFVGEFWMRENSSVVREELPKNRDGRFEDRHQSTLFQDETALDAGPTNLLFQAVYVYDMAGPLTGIVASCRLTNEWVESRVNCSRDGSGPRQTCQVVAQRPSKRRHASANISPLSFPLLFNLVSLRLPLAVGGHTNVGTEVSLYYLQNPCLAGISRDATLGDMLHNITGETLQIRLAQLLNTYLALGQLSHQIRGAGGSFLFDSNVTVPSRTSELIVVYDISDKWAAACLASSIMLLAAGVLGVVFKHCARGPEVLGYVSTVFRDSRHMDLPADAGRQNGMDLSRAMRDSRIRYGVTKLTKDGEPVIGVGLQETTEAVSYAR